MPLCIIQVIDAVLSDSLPHNLQEIEKGLPISGVTLTAEAGTTISKCKIASTSLLNFNTRPLKDDTKECDLEPDLLIKSQVLSLVAKQQTDDIRDAMRAGLIIDADPALRDLVPGLRQDDLDVIDDEDSEFVQRYYEGGMKDRINHEEDEYDDTLDQFGLSVEAGDEEALDEQEKEWGRNRIRGGRWEDETRRIGTVKSLLHFRHFL